VPVAQLRLWVATTRRVLELGPRLFGDRFLLMRYDDLMASPRDEIGRMAGFLGIDAVPVDRLVEGIEPTTVGRYRERDLSAFPDDLLHQVEAQGFTIA
jgi:hypothetical protein